MFWEIFFAELYLSIINYIDSNLNYIIIFSINFLFIFYFKLDQDSKNFLFNFLSCSIYKIELIRDLHSLYLSEKKKINLNKKK